jgi:hypothetical protein
VTVPFSFLNAYRAAQRPRAKEGNRIPSGLASAKCTRVKRGEIEGEGKGRETNPNPKVFLSVPAVLHVDDLVIIVEVDNNERVDRLR